MAASTVTTAFTNDTDANFRLWINAIHNAMLAGGWTLSANTGQIDFATVTRPLAANTFQGYAFYESNDGTADFAEILIKIEFGAHSSVATVPAIAVTVGWTSNGAANMTGITTTRKVIQSSSNLASTPLRFGIGAGYICMALGDGTSSTGLLFSLERTRNASNQELNEVLIAGNHQSGGWFSQVAEKDVYSYVAEATAGTMMPTAANDTINGFIGTGVFCGSKAGFTTPSLNLSGVNLNKLGPGGSQVVINTHGANHNFMVLENYLAFNFAQTTNVHTLMRYE